MEFACGGKAATKVNAELRLVGGEALGLRSALLPLSGPRSCVRTDWEGGGLGRRALAHLPLPPPSARPPRRRRSPGWTPGGLRAASAWGRAGPSLGDLVC